MIAPSFIGAEYGRKWCRVIQDAARPYFAGGIFPRELAAFLAACDACSVDWIVESGRQDGYSASVLADYGEVTGVPVASIDDVRDLARDAAARARLAGRKITVLNGAAEAVLPDAVGEGARRVALLIDGPKGRAANRLILAAAATFPIVLFAYHGWRPDSVAGRELKRWFPDTTLAELDGHEFAAFRRWEQELVTPALRSRSFERSSLAIGRVEFAVRPWPCLLIHDRGRALLESASYVVRRLRRKPLTVPATLIARDWARRRPKRSGGGGIRTHGGSRLSGFQDRAVRPLRHPAEPKA